MEAPAAFSYSNFMRFALSEAQLHTKLTPLTSNDGFRCIRARDKKTVLHTLSHEAPKVRLFRSISIDGGCTMQVLDFTILPKPEFDLPIFCANFYSNPRLSIVVLDLNPLHDVIIHRDYKDKYYKKLLHLGRKYLQAWLDLMDKAEEEDDPAKVLQNRRAQHRYLTWRAEKDPGRPLLEKLVEERMAGDLVRNFLFDGVDYLGSETFLDYFPDYRCDDGTINRRRSMIGKPFETRPWDERGEFIGGQGLCS